jgi:hypothetical protein
MIDISDLKENTPLRVIKAKALEFAKGFRIMPPQKVEPSLDNDVVGGAIQAINNLSAHGRLLFMFTIAREFGGIQAFKVVQAYHYEEVNHYRLRISTMEEAVRNVVDDLDIKHWNELMDTNWMLRRGVWLPTTISIVVPLGAKFDLDAETHTHTWATYEENTYSAGTENYVDVYFSAEFGAKIPLAKVFTFDTKLGVKVGEKHFKKDEEKQGQRFGAQISKAFILTKVGRNALEYYPGLANEAVVNPLAVQTGYALELKDLNKKMGMYWNGVGPADGVESGSAYQNVASDIQEMVDATGLELERRVVAMRYNKPRSSYVP